MATLTKAFVVLFAVALVGLGVQLIAVSNPDLSAMGHTREALPAVLGGRFLSFGLLLAALVALSEWRALMVVLASGAVMGIVDVFVEPAQYAGTHLGFAAVCLAPMAALYWWLRPANSISDDDSA